jgi:hypothetical protein
VNILRNPPKRAPRQALRAFNRWVSKTPRYNFNPLGFARRARRALGIGGLATAASLLFATQAQAFHKVRDDPVKAHIKAYDLLAPSTTRPSATGWTRTASPIFRFIPALHISSSAAAGTMPITAQLTQLARRRLAPPLRIDGGQPSGRPGSYRGRLLVL